MELAETQISVSRFSGSFKSCNGLALQENPIKLDLPTKGNNLRSNTEPYFSTGSPRTDGYRAKIRRDTSQLPLKNFAALKQLLERLRNRIKTHQHVFPEKPFRLEIKESRIFESSGEELRARIPVTVIPVVVSVLEFLGRLFRLRI